MEALTETDALKYITALCTTIMPPLISLKFAYFLFHLYQVVLINTSPDVLKFFFGHWVPFHSFSVQSMYLIIFIIMFFLVSLH